MGKSQRPIVRVQELTQDEADLLDRNVAVKVTRAEQALMRYCANPNAWMLYMCLASHCDTSTGNVEGVTYASLGRWMNDDDQNPAGRARVRLGLLELDDIGLIVFDRSTPQPRSGPLGVAMPYQVKAKRKTRRRL